MAAGEVDPARAANESVEHVDRVAKIGELSRFDRTVGIADRDPYANSRDTFGTSHWQEGGVGYEPDDSLVLEASVALSSRGFYCVHEGRVWDEPTEGTATVERQTRKNCSAAQADR